MSSKELKTRDQIDKKYKWNIEAMISDETVIDTDLENIRKMISWTNCFFYKKIYLYTL